MSEDILLEDGDIIVSNVGDLERVADFDKLVQDLRKAVLTTLGTNKYHIDYGCTIGEDIIGMALPDWAIQNQAVSSLTNTITTLKVLQAQQRTVQDVTPGEMILSINDINLERDKTDSRQVNISVSVISEALTTAEVGFVINP